MGHLISKHNLIIYRYWKLSFFTSFCIVLIILSLIWGILYLTISPSILELIVIAHFLLFIGFLIQTGIILYTNYKKNLIQKRMNFLHEERETLTFYQLKNKLMEYNFSLGNKYWTEKWEITNSTLYQKEEHGLVVLLKNRENETFNINTNHKVMKQKLTVSENSLPYIIELYRIRPFTEHEEKEIFDEITTWLTFLIEQEQLLNLKYKMEDRIYTSLERSTYLREMRLADVYHNMISQYLHDDIQQYIYYIRHIVFSEESLIDIRKHIKDITKDMENSIKLKTIEWTGYPNNEKEIDQLIFELSIALEEYFPSNIALDMDIDVDAFEQNNTANKQILYRIIKEAIINSYKHANATYLLISLKKNIKKWHLIIEDDGEGWESDINSTNRFGLASIYRQVKTNGGQIDITTAKNKGFKINIHLPEMEEYK